SVFMAPELVSELSIFPNPCQGQCWVKLVPQVQSNLVLQAFDLHGRSIAQWGVQAFSGQELLIDIQTQSWPSGIYLFKLSDQSGRLLGSLRLAK
ncbi:MAG: T9SS type A sorting domain-containing protein, partial [Bacteroidota bacterium]